MARTKASVGAKISSGKSSKARCSVAPVSNVGVSSGGSDKSSRGSGGGNPVCPRETPKWQKPITNFFVNKPNDSRESDGDGEVATSSKSKPKSKRNVIESDDETSPEKPRNNALEESIELQELTGENSHKIEEYYQKGAKGKGVGKKTKETKNRNSNGAKETEDDDETSDGKSEENLDKENIDSNMDSEKINGKANDKDGNTSLRSKREREDRIEEGNVSKKIKVN